MRSPAEQVTTVRMVPSTITEGALHLGKTYHDSVEAAYKGNAYNYHGLRSSVRVPPLRNQPAYLDPLVSVPSYHFGLLLSEEFDSPSVASPPVAAITADMEGLGLDKVAVVFDSRTTGNTYIVTFRLTEGRPLAIACSIFDVSGGISGRPEVWISFPGNWVQSNSASAMICAAAAGLKALASPSIEYAMAQSPDGVQKMAEGRKRRGEALVAPMQTVHLTNRIYIGGRAIQPNGSGVERSPHDRRGHWRHSLREHPGWEGPMVPMSGEWQGVTCYRRWINTVEVHGGARERALHLANAESARPVAPQYRVVR